VTGALEVLAVLTICWTVEVDAEGMHWLCLGSLGALIESVGFGPDSSRLRGRDVAHLGRDAGRKSECDA
jgi:hypothetical protein